MGKNRGFLLKNRIQTVFRWPATTSYRLLDSPSPSPPHVSKICKWTRILRSKVKSICCLGSSKNMMVSTHHHRGMQTGEEEEEEVPKGYMPVYVGQQRSEFERVLVPVVYFNDPLFGQLLREAEEEFGFDHPGAITIPCPISHFEHVQTRIKQRNNSARKFLTWKSQSSCI